MQSFYRSHNISTTERLELGIPPTEPTFFRRCLTFIPQHNAATICREFAARIRLPKKLSGRCFVLRVVVIEQTSAFCPVNPISCCRPSKLQSLFMDAFGTVTKTADLRRIRSQMLNSGWGSLPAQSNVTVRTFVLLRNPAGELSPSGSALRNGALMQCAINYCER